MSEHKHTPEPWTTRGESIWSTHESVSGPVTRRTRTNHVCTLSARLKMPEGERLANAERIVACVNGCAGINPAVARAAVNSYGHFANPLAAAEQDLLGKALAIIQRYHSACKCDAGCQLCEEADTLLTMVKED